MNEHEITALVEEMIRYVFKEAMAVDSPAAPFRA